MTNPQPFTDAQLTALREIVADAVHQAVAPIARQTTAWIQAERRRLADPRRTATGTPVGQRPRLLDPDHPKNRAPLGEKGVHGAQPPPVVTDPPALEPTIRFVGDPHREG